MGLYPRRPDYGAQTEASDTGGPIRAGGASPGLSDDELQGRARTALRGLKQILPGALRGILPGPLRGSYQGKSLTWWPPTGPFFEVLLCNLSQALGLQVHK